MSGLSYLFGKPQLQSKACYFARRMSAATVTLRHRQSVSYNTLITCVSAHTATNPRRDTRARLAADWCVTFFSSRVGELLVATAVSHASPASTVCLVELILFSFSLSRRWVGAAVPGLRVPSCLFLILWFDSPPSKFCNRASRPTNGRLLLHFIVSNSRQEK